MPELSVNILEGELGPYVFFNWCQASSLVLAQVSCT